VLFGLDTAAPLVAPDTRSNDGGLAGISATGSRLVQQSSPEGAAASTQPIGVAALFLDEALRGTMTPGDLPGAAGRARAGVPVATTTIRDYPRKEQTVGSAEGVAWNAAVVDKILDGIFEDDALDFVDQRVVDDVSGATLPPSDGETLDKVFAQFDGPEVLATGLERVNLFETPAIRN
jgi:hypothetical protein